jgi:hypothetical protein
MKKSQVFFWVPEVQRARGDLSNEERSGRLPATGLDEILAYRLARDPHTTARRLAGSWEISPQTVIAHLHEGLGMKYFHLRWVLHTLIDTQKANSVRYAQEMIRDLWVFGRRSFCEYFSLAEAKVDCDSKMQRLGTMMFWLFSGRCCARSATGRSAAIVGSSEFLNCRNCCLNRNH